MFINTVQWRNGEGGGGGGEGLVHELTLSYERYAIDTVFTLNEGVLYSGHYTCTSSSCNIIYDVLRHVQLNLHVDLVRNIPQGRHCLKP